MGVPQNNHCHQAILVLKPTIITIWLGEYTSIMYSAIGQGTRCQGFD